MRENIGLFKAKRKDNGDWVYGCMQFDSLRKIYWIVEEVDDGYYNGVENVEQRAFNEYEIDPETLCECTGLKDKNGKLIFENDIVKFSFRYGPNREKFINENLIVKWSDEFLSYEFGKSKWDACLIANLKNKYKVIGNKFDNKELLGEKI